MTRIASRIALAVFTSALLTVPLLAVSSAPPQAVRTSKANAVHASRRREDWTGGVRSAIECCIGFRFPLDRPRVPTA